MLHLIPDLVALLIAVLTVILAYRRGFVRTLISTVGIVCALLASAFLSEPLAMALEQTPLTDALHSRTASVLDEYAEQEADGDRLALANDPDSSLHTLLQTVGADGSAFDEWLSEAKLLDPDAFREALVTYVAIPLTHMLLRTVASLLLFFGTLLLLKLLSKVLSATIEQIPFLRGANRTLGLVLGILLAVARVWIFGYLLCALLNAAAVTHTPFLSAIDPQKSLLLRFF